MRRLAYLQYSDPQPVNNIAPLRSLVTHADGRRGGFHRCLSV